MPLTAAESLAAGLAEHRAGNLAGAAMHYCRTLETAPGQTDAMHLLGLLLSEQGEHGRALGFLSRAVELHPNAVYLANLGLALRRAGDLAGALSAYRQALALQPDHAPTLDKLGRALIDAGRYSEAEAALGQASLADGCNAGLRNALGRARAEQGRHAEARMDFEAALDLDPAYEEAARNLAGALLHLSHDAAGGGDWQRALTLIEEACRRAPALAQAWYGRGLAASVLRRLEESRQCYEQAIALHFNYAEAHNNLGHVLEALSRPREAMQAYERALAIRPGYTGAEYNLALSLQNAGRLREAEALYETLLAREPGHADARNNLGGIRLGENRWQEAAAEFAVALTHKPTHGEARWNLALSHLAQGDFERGWPLYEARLEQPGFPRRDFDCPRWTGEELAGLTICVWAEQGLGDTIQFMRYLPALLQRGARVSFEVQERLAPFLARVLEADRVRVVARGGAVPQADYHVPLLSLPLLAGGNQVAPVWLPGRIEAAPLGGGSGRPARRRVGLCWAGHPHHVKGRARSMPLAALAPLLALEEFEFVSLQRGPQAAECDDLPDGLRLHAAEREEGGIAELAAIVASLDLVITVDTMVAHLAGTLGRPVWTLLPFAADWRWMGERTDTPWYGTMRLFRQTRPGDWAGVAGRVAEELTALGPAAG